jgi:hypothetical protein
MLIYKQVLGKKKLWITHDCRADYPSDEFWSTRNRRFYDHTQPQRTWTPRLNVNGERWSESRRDSQPYLAHQIAERIALFFNIGNWIEDWQQFAFNGGQDCADKNKITSKIICFSKCWMSLLSLTYFFNSLHVISLPFSRLVFAFLSL